MIAFTNKTAYPTTASLPHNSPIPPPYTLSLIIFPIINSLSPLTFLCLRRRRPKPQSTRWGPNLTDFAHLTDRSFMLDMIFAAIVGTGNAGRAGVNGREGGGAQVKFGEGVVLDVDFMLGGSFALGVDAFGLG